MTRFRLLALLGGVSALVLGLSSSPAQNAGAWGAVKGRIKFAAAPEAQKVDVNNDKEHCLSKGPLVRENYIVNPQTKGLKNVVVWLRVDDADPKSVNKTPFPQDKIKPALAKPAPKNHVIDQPCCQFVPRILAAREGDTLEFKNSAPVSHNVNYNSDEEQINPTLPPGKSLTLSKPLKAQTSPIPFKCDIHPWMAGRVRVFDHPYFATTDENGNFEIKDAPAGKWRLVIWHEEGNHKGRDGRVGMPIEIKGGGTLELQPIEYEPPAPAK